MGDLLEIMQAERAFEEAALTKPFDPADLKNRKGSYGKVFDYVEGHKIIQRLNEATGNKWSCKVESTQKVKAENRVDQKTGEITEYPTYWSAVVTVIIPSMGARSQVGTKPITGNEEDDLKAAITDGIKKAATLFGIALDLHDDDSNANSNRSGAGKSSGRAPARSNSNGKSSDNTMITPTQKNAILAIGRSNQLTEGHLLDMVAEQFGAASFEDLTKPQASEFIQSLQKL